jgi:hypothetical protein
VQGCSQLINDTSWAEVTEHCSLFHSLCYLSVFVEDGAHSSRYAPYSPNSGFYYVRQNERTKYFFEVFIRMGELIVGKSHF